MEKNEFKNIEKTLKKIVNLNEISHLNHTKFIKILKQDKKNSKNSFRLILSKGVGKMFVKELKNTKIVKDLIKKYLIYVK